MEPAGDSRRAQPTQTAGRLTARYQLDCPLVGRYLTGAVSFRLGIGTLPKRQVVPRGQGVGMFGAQHPLVHRQQGLELRGQRVQARRPPARPRHKPDPRHVRSEDLGYDTLWHVKQSATAATARGTGTHGNGR